LKGDVSATKQKIFFVALLACRHLVPPGPRIALRRHAVQISRITHNPAVMGGKPCIRGLRVTAGTILGLLASGHSRERILQAYPYLEPEDIDAALAYAAWRLEEREEVLVVA
jgi:uncharacterized protein (DUF433 family)